MSTPTIDFSKYEQQASAPSIDFSKYESKPAVPPEKPKSLWERMGIVPNLNATPPLKPGEQAGPSGEGSPGEQLIHGLGEGAKTAGKAYLDKGPAEIGRGSIDVAHGDVKRGLNRVFSGASITALPLAPEAIAANPLIAARAIGGGYVGGKVGETGTALAGGDEEAQKLAGNVGNLVGGTVAGTGAIRAFLQSPAKAALSKAATATDGIVSDDVLGVISPRLLHGLRMLRAANKISSGMEESGLSSIAAKHTEAISGLESQLNEALAKANALPPEGPTAQFKDVPDLRVQPSQQAPQNLLAKPALPGRPQPQPDGTFQVVPPENAVTPSGRVTPNMEIYNEGIQPPAALKPSTLLQQIREWENIRKIHSQLEDQIGKGQDEIQQWMEEHNQQAPGAKKPSGAAATAKARFDAAKAKTVPAGAAEPRVPTSDADLEDLLMKSVQAAKAKKALAAGAD